jgi:hypothetical protein
VIDAIESLSQRPDDPVVIVMSDHGSELNLDWGNGLGSDMRERFGTLFAARTPGRPAILPDDVTPVQVFPYLLNAYLAEDIPIPRARFFASTAQDMLTLWEIERP